MNTCMGKHVCMWGMSGSESTELLMLVESSVSSF